MYLAVIDKVYSAMHLLWQRFAEPDVGHSSNPSPIYVNRKYYGHRLTYIDFLDTNA